MTCLGIGEDGPNGRLGAKEYVRALSSKVPVDDGSRANPFVLAFKAQFFKDLTMTHPFQPSHHVFEHRKTCGGAFGVVEGSFGRCTCQWHALAPCQSAFQV